MNKYTVKNISCVLIFAILLTGTFSIPIYAISTTCVQDHFSNLITTGSGDNQIIRTPPSENSCPYTAMSMLLMFYDSYWHEDFVDDNYEWQAGTYNAETDQLIETFNANAEMEHWQNYLATNYPDAAETYPYYRDYAEANAGNFLESYLVSIGISLLYHLEFIPGETTLGLTVFELVTVLQVYLYNNRFTTNEVTVHYCLENDSNDIEGMMETLIDDGYPVILFGQRYLTDEEMNGDDSGETETREKVGHFLVAYGVEDDGDISLHTGWWTGEHTSFNETQYNLNRAIIWLEVNEENLPHSHSYNYVDSVTNEPLCACQIYTSHPAHSTHLHYDISEYSINDHCYKCACGYIDRLEAHNLSYSYFSVSQHKKLCEACGYEGKENHVFDIVWKSNDLEHRLSCVCGHRTPTEAHYRHKYTSKGVTQHYIYCKCGYYFGVESHTFTQIGSYNVCDYCGYKILAPGGGMIMGDEDEPVTE